MLALASPTEPSQPHDQVVLNIRRFKLLVIIGTKPALSVGTNLAHNANGKTLDKLNGNLIFESVTRTCLEGIVIFIRRSTQSEMPI